MITVSFNGQQIELAEQASVQALLEQTAPEGAFAIAVNGDFVPRSQYDQTSLNDGDEVDLVSPVGGG